MLMLTIKLGHEFTVGTATVKVCKIDGDRVRIGIDAPEHVEIVRDDAKCRERKEQ